MRWVTRMQFLNGKLIKQTKCKPIKYYILNKYRVISNFLDEPKQEDVLSMMPYIRRDSDIDFDPQNREKMRKTEMERQKRNYSLLNLLKFCSQRNNHRKD